VLLRIPKAGQLQFSACLLARAEKLPKGDCCWARRALLDRSERASRNWRNGGGACERYPSPHASGWNFLLTAPEFPSPPEPLLFLGRPRSGN
jgi:hypothetical protein